MGGCKNDNRPLNNFQFYIALVAGCFLGIIDYKL